MRRLKYAALGLLALALVAVGAALAKFESDDAPHGRSFDEVGK